VWLVGVGRVGGEGRRGLKEGREEELLARLGRPEGEEDALRGRTKTHYDASRPRL